MFRHINLIIFFAFIAVSCSNNQSGKKKDNIEKQALYAIDIQLDDKEAVLKFPYRIKKIDSMLLIWDLHGRENFFHAFTLNDKTTDYLFSFGNVGRGPEEFVACAGMNIRDEHLSIIETNKAILYFYPVKNLKNMIAKPDRILDLPKELVPIIKFTDMGENGTIVLDSKGKNRFIILNNEGEIEEKLYQIPNEENKDLIAPILQQVWVSCLDYNPNNNILAIATSLGDVIEIYNLKQKTNNILVGEQGEPSIVRENQQMIIRSANGYQDIIVGDSEIYALYSNITHEDMKIANNEGIVTPNGGNLIYVLDFDGNIKKILTLDRYINGFDIDLSEKTIYGVTSNSDIQLCVFKM